jgi:NAD+ diphosphatase
MTIKSNLYAGCGLDRMAPRRKDAVWIAEKQSGIHSRILPVWRSQTLIDITNPKEPRLGWLPAHQIGVDLTKAPETELTLLGLEEDTVWFALDVSEFDDPQQHLPPIAPSTFLELRTVGSLLPRSEANIAAYARGLMWWHQRHRYCGVCGHLTIAREAGHVRVCSSSLCATQHFPRTDPAVIMLVHDGNRCLLGRQPRFPPGLYSTLAGFVEPGESIEDAVAREVFEETGIRITDIEYNSSQPWPFPSSLMLGFFARAVSTEITLQPEEMEDARWFTREELLAPTDTGFALFPRADSISRHLIEQWLAR